MTDFIEYLVAEVSFVEVQYVVTEGSTFQLCVKTEDDLQTSIQLDLRIGKWPAFILSG